MYIENARSLVVARAIVPQLYQSSNLIGQFMTPLGNECHSIHAYVLLTALVMLV